MDASLLVFGAAYHFDNPTVEDDGVSEYREFNPGLGLRLDWEVGTPIVRGGLIAGGYRNSFNERSYFGGVCAQAGDSVGVELALIRITGYWYLEDRLYLVPGFYVKADRYSLHTLILDEALGFYVEIKL